MAVGAPKDQAKTKGYSLLASEHELVAEQARQRGVNASQLVRKAVLWYIRTFPVGSPEPPMPMKQEAQ